MRVRVAKIDACQRIVPIRPGVAVGHDDADRRFFQNVCRGAGDEDIGGLHALEVILANRERANVPAADPSGQFAALRQVHRTSALTQADPARKVRLPVLEVGTREREAKANPEIAYESDLPELKDVGVAQKEVPFLREEEVETGELHLAVVHLGGREIGVQGQRRIQ